MQKWATPAKILFEKNAHLKENREGDEKAESHQTDAILTPNEEEMVKWKYPTLLKGLGKP